MSNRQLNVHVNHHIHLDTCLSQHIRAIVASWKIRVDDLTNKTKSARRPSEGGPSPDGQLVAPVQTPSPTNCQTPSDEVSGRSRRRAQVKIALQRGPDTLARAAIPVVTDVVIQMW